MALPLRQRQCVAVDFCSRRYDQDRSQPKRPELEGVQVSPALEMPRCQERGARRRPPRTTRSRTRARAPRRSLVVPAAARRRARAARDENRRKSHAAEIARGPRPVSGVHRQGRQGELEEPRRGESERVRSPRHRPRRAAAAAHAPPTTPRARAAAPSWLRRAQAGSTARVHGGRICLAHPKSPRCSSTRAANSISCARNKPTPPPPALPPARSRPFRRPLVSHALAARGFAVRPSRTGAGTRRPRTTATPRWSACCWTTRPRARRSARGGGGAAHETPRGWRAARVAGRNDESEKTSKAEITRCARRAAPIRPRAARGPRRALRGARALHRRRCCKLTLSRVIARDVGPRPGVVEVARAPVGGPSRPHARPRPPPCAASSSPCSRARACRSSHFRKMCWTASASSATT